MNKALTVSIVIPAYNEEYYLAACLEAIATQDDMPDEVIVVDNNSRDRTVDIARTFPFVTVLHESRQGVVFARNTGFDAATSHLIARIDADSQLPPNWVKDIKEVYGTHGSPTFFAATGPSDFRNIIGRFTWYPLHRIFYFWASHIWLGHTTLSGSNMFMTQILYETVRPRLCNRTDIHEDMDLAIHIHRAGYSIAFYRHPKNSMMNRKLAYKMKYYLPMFWRIRFIRHQSCGEAA